MINPKISRGLYRHFKGNYYYVLGVVLNCVTEKWEVHYTKACDSSIFYTRDLDDFCECGDTIKNRKDNVTGQYGRFEKVTDLRFEVGSLSTQQLLDELLSRQDSPLFGVDLDEVESKVFDRDYVVGIPLEGKHLLQWIGFGEDREEAIKYAKENPARKLYRRTLVQEDFE